MHNITVTQKNTTFSFSSHNRQKRYKKVVSAIRLGDLTEAHTLLKSAGYTDDTLILFLIAAIQGPVVGGSDEQM
jgi:hypothetical protein